ncbi:hypothetical protein [uncultured Hyphomicrobium sp.]|uniref:hypothetical protein n=1 Tax=uncultured Hyphomicrobium sp. TaxID=194373 RepID=UPI0025F0C1AC|nr:hypothetical protein [uncultured Hyphomicrobium sp.]
MKSVREGGGAERGAVVVDYTNYRGERRWRRIIPLQLVFTSNRWHPKPQWLLRAIDKDKREARAFALTGIHAWAAPSSLPDARMADPTAQTEPLTTGQLIVAEWETNPIYEPCNLAQAIDDAITARAEALETMLREWVAFKLAISDKFSEDSLVARTNRLLGV